MRLFIAVKIPDEIKEKIHNSFLYSRDSLEFARFTETDNLHITLVFLGEVEDALLERIKRIVESVTNKYSQKRIELSGIVIGPDINTARMIWLKLGDDSQKYLESISQSLKKELKDKNILFDGRNFFNGHVTLAKFGQNWQSKYDSKNEKGKTEDINFIKETLPETFEAHFDSKSITLFSSKKIDGKRIYEPLFESDFKG